MEQEVIVEQKRNCGTRRFYCPDERISKVYPNGIAANKDVDFLKKR